MKSTSSDSRRPVSEWLLLGSGLALPVVAIALYGDYPLFALALLILIELCLLLGVMRLLGIRRTQRTLIRQLQKTLIGQRVTDPETGAALPGWFEQVLQTECRRAIREFTPLAVMQIDLKGGEPAQRDAVRTELSKMLTRELSRPGDLVGLTDTGMLQVLMPSTNEHCKHLAERFQTQAQLVRADSGVELRIAACVMQPGSDLSADKVNQQLLRLVDRLSAQPDGSIGFEVEQPANEIPTVTYSL